MKITCTQENLSQGLLTTSHVATKSVNLPILSNVLIQARKNTITISATNLEMGVINSVRGKIEEDGDITIQSKLLSDYINLLPKENVTLSVKGDSDEVFVNVKNSVTKIKGIGASDYPLIPKIKKEDAITCKTQDLRKALSQVIFSVSLSETRPEINGVLFTISSNTITLAGTDSYRLSEKIIEVKTSVKEDSSIIVPAKTLQELLRILSSMKDSSQIENIEDVEIYISENQILFSFAGVEVISRLIEGRYPNYKEIIPQKFQTEVTVNTEALIKAIKTSSLFSRTGMYDVNLELNPKTSEVVVVSQNAQVGENTTRVPAEIKGEKNNIIVNFRFLLDGLAVMDSEDIVIEVVNSTSPCIVTPKDQKEYLYIVMPIK